MHLTILALGSRGDIQPFIPLGRGLQQAGHRVRLATFQDFRAMIQETGLEYALIRGDARQLLDSAVGANLLTERINPLRTMRAIGRSYGALAESLPEDIARLGGTDLVLNQLPANLFGGDLAEHLNVPWAVVAVIPLMRTKSRPLIGFPARPSSIPGYNMATYRIGEQIGWQLFRRAVNRLRTELFDLSGAPFWGPYRAIYEQALPVLCGFSGHVVPRPPDWGSNVHLTGWWHSDDPEWNPPPDLERFIGAGPPPVFVGFGSMPVPNPQLTTQLVIEAVQLTGQRAVIHRGWAGLGGDLPPDVFPIDYAPYEWLFPRMAAVVHHGGSGTSGDGFRSGVPSVVVPFGFDQFYWGQRAFELGVGPAPVPFRKLTAAGLASAIDTAVSDPEIRARTAEIGAKLQAENGVQRAIGIIETLV